MSRINGTEKIKPRRALVKHCLFSLYKLLRSRRVEASWVLVLDCTEWDSNLFIGKVPVPVVVEQASLLSL